MRAWSGAWNVAEVPCSRDDVRIIQVRRTGKGCLSYVVGTAGEAAVIDASVRPEVYLGVAKDNGWRISSLIETHLHADHLSRARALALSTGARLFLPAQKRASYTHVPVHDSDTLSLGRHGDLFTAIRTPGHTAESTSYLIEGAAVFTGDTLFLQSVGRPDLEAGLAEAATRARDLYRSLRRLRALPEGTLVLPAHASAPTAFDGVPICATLAQVERQNGLLAVEENAFVSSVLERIPPTPANFARIMECNESGELPEGELIDLEGGSNRCSVG
jgi:glyoxylase-like metal-dependent hydrolase (beta-lactamase superfamily II)